MYFHYHKIVWHSTQQTVSNGHPWWGVLLLIYYLIFYFIFNNVHELRWKEDDDEEVGKENKWRKKMEEWREMKIAVAAALRHVW